VPARPSFARGQATLELLALIPLLAGVAVGVLAGLAWLGACGRASDASLRGARALALGADARAAAIAALPPSARRGATVFVTGDRVRVRLRVGGRLGRLLPPASGVARR
jgi:hypothetical protein